MRSLAQIRPFGWSKYDLRRDSDRIDFIQVVGRSSTRDVGDVGWDGRERIAFRMHVPSEILFHNSAADIRRGNILEWEQPLSARARGEPLELRVQMAPDSILRTTLILFGSTILAAAMTFAAVVWWLARRGRQTDVAESSA